jgi:hypothetical protein
MIHEKENIAIFKKLNPDGCFHEFNLDTSNYCLKGCGADYKECDKPINPNYFTPNGNQLIKAWLIKEGEWKDFDFFLEEKNYNFICRILERAKRNKQKIPIEYPNFYLHTCTDPRKFATKFYECIERKDK